LALIVIVAGAAACAPALAPAPVVTAPRHPEFIFPGSPPGLASGNLSLRLQRGWQFLQAGDTKASRREFQAVLRRNPRFYPADAGLAYVSLAEKDYADALARFDRALARNARYVPALVGRGDALAATGKADDARQAYELALAEDATLGDVRRRLEVIGFHSQQASLQAAREAAQAGRSAEAVAAYERAIASSPESAFLYRELADVERQQGKLDAALGHLKKAVTVDPSDARAWILIGQVHESRGEYADALAAYRKAEAIEPGEETAGHRARAASRAALSRLPQEYRDIPGTPSLTRGELAALVGVRLDSLVSGNARRDSVVVTDARSHWASAWIIAVVRAGVMEPFPNHTFMPRAVVRRIDLAHVVQRLLSLVAARQPALGRQWLGGRPRIADLPPGHLGYPAVAAAVTAGIMPLAEGSTFRPSRVVTGAEAIEVIGRLEVLAR
jgi:tetratricopeptide (TPR) repeat protein